MAWIHVGLSRGLYTAYLCAASGLWLSNLIIQMSISLIRNTGRLASTEQTSLLPGNTNGTIDALVLRVRLKRPCRIRHGQYVYITLPSVPNRLVGHFQAHPYMIAWTDEILGQKSSDFQLLIQCRHGFSDRLRLCRQPSTVIVDGPYGKETPLKDFDKVLFIAAGGGIAAHLLAIRQLLQAHEDRTARCRRLSLLWVLEDQGAPPICLTGPWKVR